MEWTESLQKAIRYMEGHLLEDISTEDIAKEVYMSPFYFQKAFKIMTGYSISEYIRKRSSTWRTNTGMTHRRALRKHFPAFMGFRHYKCEATRRK